MAFASACSDDLHAVGSALVFSLTKKGIAARIVKWASGLPLLRKPMRRSAAHCFQRFRAAALRLQATGQGLDLLHHCFHLLLGSKFSLTVQLTTAARF